jgi:hypothetical protein
MILRTVSVNMGDKILKVTKYLHGCQTIEKEVSLLYTTATKKLPSPQLSTITTAIAFDKQKHAAVIEELLKPLSYIALSPNELSAEFKSGVEETRKLRNAIAVHNDLNPEEIEKFLKNLTNLEDSLSDLYGNLIDSKLLEDYSKDVADEPVLSSENLKYILQAFKQDNLKHRDMLIESLYFYKKNLQKNIDNTPKVRYNNPDSWYIYS